jgi:hypothetical protein
VELYTLTRNGVKQREAEVQWERTRRLQEEWKRYRKAIRQGSVNPQTFVRLVELYEMRDEKGLALETCWLGLKEHPTHPVLLAKEAALRQEVAQRFQQ